MLDRPARTLTIAAFGASAVLALAACEGLDPVEAGFTVAGTVENAGEAPTPVQMSFIYVPPTTVAALDPATPSDIDLNALGGDDVVSLGGAVLRADGAFSTPLPRGADVPSDLMVQASQAVEFFGIDDCTFAASAAVDVSYILIAGGVPLPTFVVGGLKDVDSVAGVVVYADFDFSGGALPLTSFRMQSWVYAEAPVTITGSCSYDTGGGSEVVQTVDLSLEQGWNPVVQLVSESVAGSLAVGVVANGVWSFVSVD